MSRLMAVSLTAEQVIAHQKTVTRRLGWEFLRPGDRLTLCRKVQGRHRRDGTVEPLERLAEVEVIDARREPLSAIIGQSEDVAAEGFPGWCAGDFISMFCREIRCYADTVVTRIEWRYLDDEVVSHVP